jgi:hypothetical protein
MFHSGSFAAIVAVTVTAKRSEIMKAPCKECAERHYKCHVECVQYKAWKAEQEKIKEHLKELKINEHYQNELEYFSRKDRKKFKEGKNPKFRARY